MDAIEQENVELRKEVTTIKADLGRLNALVDSLVAAQNQPPPPPPPQTTVTIEHVAPVSVAPICTPQYTMLEGYPWGMPLHYNIGYQSNVFEIPILVVPNTTVIPQLGKTIPQVTVTIPQPTVTISTHVLNEPIYNVEPTESVGAYGRLDDFPEQFDEMQREIRALRGNDLFGKNAHDLCLVPNVRIPTKFKVPEFEV
jgi:hypothetical protein